MSTHATGSFLLRRFSSAHCCLAPSNWRKLFTQALLAGVVLARIKAGSNAATTIISTAATEITILKVLGIGVTMNEEVSDRGQSALVFDLFLRQPAGCDSSCRRVPQPCPADWCTGSRGGRVWRTSLDVGVARLVHKGARLDRPAR